MKPVAFHPRARAELDDAIGWYNHQRAGLGLELLDDLLNSLAKIKDDPRIGALFDTQGSRFHRLKRFPYVVYYQELSGQIWIAAIAHDRRRPGYWKRRKPS